MQKNAEKNYRFAVIGCGPMGKRHAEGIIAKNCTVPYFCDTNDERLNQIKEVFGEDGHKYIKDYNELVNSDEIDGVILVTPDQIHCEMVTKFLRAGKVVFCEKPMALTVEECEEMMRVEKETGGKLMIGQICRCTPGFMRAKQLIDEGRIGELTFIESEYAHNYINARGIDDWRMVPARHGFIGGGCHAVDLLRWIAGDPTEIHAYANHKALLDWPTDDTTISILKFPNDVIGKVFVSTGCKRKYTMRSVFYGTKGTIICDNRTPYIRLFEDNEELELSFANDPQKLPVELADHNCALEMEMFIDALRAGGEMPVTSYDGASTVAVCCAGVQSIREDRPITIKYPEKF